MEGENLICIAARATLIIFKYSFRPIECRVVVSLGCIILQNGAIVRGLGNEPKIKKGELNTVHEVIKSSKNL